MVRVRKVYLTLLAGLWLITGCSYNSGRVQLLNWNSWNNWSLFGAPDTITVQKGDTLYSISKRYNVPLRDLIEANNLTPPYTLTIGRTLRLPLAKTHTVAKGDTLYSISKRYDVDLTTLSKFNNLQTPYTLSIGQKLAIPGSVSNTVSATNTHTSHPKTTATTASQQTVKSSSASTQTTTKKTTAASTTPKKTTTTTQKTTTVSTVRKNKFAWPLKGTILSRYGTIGKGRNNDGINIKAKLGAEVKAADSGKVAYAGNELKGFGNLILIKHDDGWITAYAHNDRLFVKKGQSVRKGEKIAAAGSTGSVNTPQLHFEIRSGKKALNPLNYLP